MDVSKIASDYKEFLCSLEAKGGYVCEEDDSDVSRAADELDRLVMQRKLGLLSDRELTQLYSGLGGQAFVQGVGPDVKAQEFAEILPELLSPEITSGIGFGCGPGFLEAFFNSRKLAPWRMAGLDGAEGLVKYARQTCEDLGVESKFYHSMADNTGLPDDSFDLTFSIALIDCCPNWRDVIQEMIRVARKRIVILYGIVSPFRRIDAWDVVQELSKSAAIDAPKFLDYGCSKCDGAMITASKVRVPLSSGIVIATV